MNSITDIKELVQGKSRIDRDVIKFMKEADLDDLLNRSHFEKNKYVRIPLFKLDNVAVYMICWGKGSRSPPHNHPKGGCILRFLSGKVHETSFMVADDDQIKETKDTMLERGAVGIKFGDQLHSMDTIEDAVSIHLYFPGDYCPKYYGERPQDCVCYVKDILSNCVEDCDDCENDGLC